MLRSGVVIERIQEGGTNYVSSRANARVTLLVILEFGQQKSLHVCSQGLEITTLIVETRKK